LASCTANVPTAPSPGSPYAVPERSNRQSLHGRKPLCRGGKSIPRASSRHVCPCHSRHCECRVTEPGGG
jgi:hypothetical protein